MSADPVDTVARTAWGEARGCGRAGMAHVVNVITNRANHPSWWGSSFASVCTQPYQFSCWNADDPNLHKLLNVTDADVDFRIALDLARLAVAAQLPDETSGADSYYAAHSAAPFWVQRATLTFRDGWHLFYRTTCRFEPNTAPNIPTQSVHSVPLFPSVTADDLNQEELDQIREQP